MRSPFFATERGIATAITKALRQAERKLTYARTMVVTTISKLNGCCCAPGQPRRSTLEW